MYPATEIDLHLDRICAAQLPSPAAPGGAFRSPNVRHQPAPLTHPGEGGLLRVVASHGVAYRIARSSGVSISSRPRGGERNVVSALEPDGVSQHGLQPDDAVAAVLPASVTIDKVDPTRSGRTVPSLDCCPGSSSRTPSGTTCFNAKPRSRATATATCWTHAHRIRAGECHRTTSSEPSIVRDDALVTGSYRHTPRHRPYPARRGRAQREGVHHARMIRLPPTLETALQSRLHDHPPLTPEPWPEPIPTVASPPRPTQARGTRTDAKPSIDLGSPGEVRDGILSIAITSLVDGSRAPRSTLHMIFECWSAAAPVR